MNKDYDQIFKLDSKGKTRVWFMEQDGDKYRTFDGIHGGTVKASSWRTAKPTNVGRSNERDGVAQATFEIEAAYTKKLKGAYYTDIADIHLGCRFFEPMLAEKYADPKRAVQTGFQPGYAQPKLDGMRAIAKADGLWSREGELIPGTAHITEWLADAFAEDPTLIFDGELYNHELKEDFNELMSLAKKANPSPERAEQIRRSIQYHVYDLPSHPGTFGERSDKLNDLVECYFKPARPETVQVVFDVETYQVDSADEFDDLHGEWVQAGYEGSMLRRDAAYVNDRTDALLKRKDFDDAEFDIVRIEQGEGNWSGAAKRVICWLPGADRSNGPCEKGTNTFEAGLRGSYSKNQALLADADNQKVVTIRYFGFTPSAVPKPRFGVATKFHGAARVG